MKAGFKTLYSLLLRPPVKRVLTFSKLPPSTLGFVTDREIREPEPPRPMPPRVRSYSSGLGGRPGFSGASASDKVSSRRVFAKVSATTGGGLGGYAAPHSRASGLLRRALILQVLASYRLPLTAREIAARTGIPDRSVRYLLNQMLREGLVARSPGPARSPYAMYAVTEKGLRFYAQVKFSNERVFAKHCRGLGGGGVRGGAGGGVVGVVGGVGVGVLRGWLVYQGMSLCHGEVGLRVRGSRLRRVLSVFWLGFGGHPRGRLLNRLMVYERGGVVHCDVVKRGVSLDDVDRLGLLLVLREYIVVWTLLTCVLKSVFPVEKLVEVTKVAPVLKVR